MFVTQNVTLTVPPAEPFVKSVTTPLAFVTPETDSLSDPENAPNTVALATGAPQSSLTVTVAWPRFLPFPAATVVTAIESTETEPLAHRPPPTSPKLKPRPLVPRSARPSTRGSPVIAALPAAPH